MDDTPQQIAEYAIPDSAPSEGPRKGPRRRIKIKPGFARKQAANARVKAREPVREAPREEARTQGVRLQRNRKRTDDKFYIDKRIIPDGMDYNWKRLSVYGKPDPHHMNALMDNHWSPVPEGRHPGLIVNQDGMVLMERPMYLTQDARREDLQIAYDQVQGVRKNLADTPDGTFTRDHPSVRKNTQLNREYVPISIPE